MSSLVWKLNRLRLMTAAEIFFRFRREIETRLEFRRLGKGWCPSPVNDPCTLTALFGRDTSILEDWNRLFKLDTHGLQDYLEGKIGFFGHENLSIGMPVDWHRDPATGKVSPQTYGKRLEYRNDSVVGNVKFLWEMGRHQHLIPLAVGYAVSGDECYRDNIACQLSRWMESNPYGTGIHWCSALEVSLRLISWALINSLLKLRDGGNDLFDIEEISNNIGHSIYQHCYFIRHYLSRHSSANNHLIGELTGLWVACKVFDLGDMGQAWADFARQELENEVCQQVYPDGVDKEQAFYYHMWVLEYLLFVRIVAARTNDEFSPEFDKRIHSMLNFLKDVSVDGGEPPQVGDADDGFVARFDPAWPKNPYSEMIGAADAVFREDIDPASQKAFWYRAISDRRLIANNFAWHRKYPVAYSDGGYAVLGGQGCQLVMDAGSLGYPAIAAHGHADALSFCMAVDGAWWIVDPGTYAYHSNAVWRNYFRGTTAHNTIVINDTDQSTIAGAFMWTRKARAQLLSVSSDENEQVARGMHDGYSRFGVSHTREIRFDVHNNAIHIIDDLVGGRDVKADIFFQFSPEISVRRDEKTGNWLVSRSNSSRNLVFILDNQWDVSLHKGQDNPPIGWYSAALELKTPAITLRGTAAYSGKLHSNISICIV